MNTESPYLSVVVPVKNEEESVATLAQEITDALAQAGVTWECVWVNDGSTDGTLAALKAIMARMPEHRIVDLDRNYGQSGALCMGFARARGSVFATLDGDGQNDPAEIPRLLGRLKQGDVAMVNGVRAKRQDSWVRKLSSRIANRVRNAVLHDNVSDTGCALRVFNRACVENIIMFKGTHRFLPALAVMRGFAITELPVHHRPRTQGVTKYGVGNRLWVGIADLYAVCWMRRRLVYPAVQAEYPGDAKR